MANGYLTGTMQPATNQMAGIPQRSLSMILVDETTPNLEEIQSFPVIYRNGNVHIHQDPSTSQMYQMTDEFHSRIPQILAGSTSAMTGGVMPPAMTPAMTGGVMTPPMTNGMTIKINTDAGMKEFPVMEMWNQAYNDYRYVNTFFDQLKDYSSTIGTVEINIINNLLNTRLDTYFKTTESRPGTIARTSLSGFNDVGSLNRNIQGSVSTPIVQTKVKFTYPNFIKILDSSTRIDSNVTSNVRFVYPSLK